jgi:hypothetical protein
MANKWKVTGRTYESTPLTLAQAIARAKMVKRCKVVIVPA